MPEMESVHSEGAFSTPVPPFLLVENLSSKWIVPTNNMWPKTDNAKGIICCLRVKSGLGKIDRIYAKLYIKSSVQPKLCQVHVPFVEEQ